MIYCYWVSMGLASLHKIRTNGEDDKAKPIKIGKFKTDGQAKEACIKHYKKACSMAVAAGRDIPEIKFI